MTLLKRLKCLRPWRGVAAGMRAGACTLDLAWAQHPSRHGLMPSVRLPGPLYILLKG